MRSLLRRIKICCRQDPQRIHVLVSVNMIHPPHSALRAGITHLTGTPTLKGATTAPGRVRRATGGFTLVEIMIVVGVVGLLTALAVPALHHVRAKAERAIVLNTLRQLFNAKEYYYTAEGTDSIPSLEALKQSSYCSSSLRYSLGNPPGGWHFVWPSGAGKSVEAREKKGSPPVIVQKLVYPDM